MGLFSFLKPQPGATAAGPATDSAGAVAAARTRARRRLIGAVLLLGIGVIAFPLLFETQPRPIPVDIPIEIPRKETVAPLAVPAPRVAQPAAAASRPSLPAELPKPVPVITESKAEASKEPAPPVEAAAKPTARADPLAKPAAPSVVPPTSAETKPASDAAGRFVVQVGAFADAGVARETRAKVDKLGLRTYTQAIDTEGGKRIRVRLGPFASRDEADKAAAKVKAAGLPAAVLTL
ncbi:MAG: SPOR domain-containing protein [Pseudomonadota bacterium]